MKEIGLMATSVGKESKLTNMESSIGENGNKIKEMGSEDSNYKMEITMKGISSVE
jgi:hypothetical protein